MEFAAPFFDHRELTMFLDDFSFERERGDDAYAFADRLEWETTERVPTTVQTLIFSYVRKAPTFTALIIQAERNTKGINCGHTPRNTGSENTVNGTSPPPPDHGREQLALVGSV